ncbi:hypothetical protein [Corallococcus sp. CA047B]|nr:hypothetical protein [Corallococcus sp. CA047B]
MSVGVHLKEAFGSLALPDHKKPFLIGPPIRAGGKAGGPTGA